ncbi:MAG: hypothetical protein WBA68_07455 [Alteraurantiacibacter sp.]
MPEGAERDIASAWENVRADDAIQFAETPMPTQPPPPDWFVTFMEWLARIFEPVAMFLIANWFWIKWMLLAIGIALVILFLVKMIAPDMLRRVTRKTGEEEDWSPDQGEALALLEEADRMAAEGRYDEATHLLLKRSVGQIAAARPDIVEPSSTARELSAEPRIPDGARSAFGVIAQRVERSLFALTKLSPEDWQAARSAYADFALQQKAIAA